jgi:ATP phosphoribosyltransferase
VSLFRIALQKKGRLHEDSIQLLTEAGIRLMLHGDRLRVPAQGFPLEAYLLRDDDIPAYLANGTADVGIVGENTLGESGLELVVLRRLGFGRCRLALAVPRESPIQALSDCQGMRIATSHPQLTRRFFTEVGLSATIVPLEGSVEIAPSLGLADAIVDIVATGTTLLMNGLREVHVFMESEAVLVASPKAPQEKVEAFLFRIDAVLAARTRKYILLNLPETQLPELLKILPGLKSPTIMPLAEKGWISVHTVVEESRFWETLHQLKAIGAEGILVMDIGKLIF